MKTATIEFNESEFIFDGVRVAWDSIPQILFELARPDPRKWYRLERVNDVLLVHVVCHDPLQTIPIHTIPSVEVSNGNYVAERSTSKENAREEGG